MQLCLAKWKIKCCCWSSKADSHFPFFTSQPLLLSASLKTLCQHTKFIMERNSSMHSSASCWDPLYLEKAASKEKMIQLQDHRYIYDSLQTLRHARNIQTQALLPTTLSSSSYKSVAELSNGVPQNHCWNVLVPSSSWILAAPAMPPGSPQTNKTPQPVQRNGALTQKVVGLFWKVSFVYVKNPKNWTNGSQVFRYTQVATS